MQFTKIKYDDKEPKVTLRWQETRKGGEEVLKHALDAKDRPEPEFVEALQAFVAEVCRLLALPQDYGQGMTVRGVSINHEDDGRRGLVVTVLKALEDANSPLVLNTPHLREYDNEESGVFASSGMIRRLDELEKRAQRYLDGHREQGDLFDESADESGTTVTITVGDETVGPFPAGRMTKLADDIEDGLVDVGAMAPA